MPAMTAVLRATMDGLLLDDVANVPLCHALRGRMPGLAEVRVPVRSQPVIRASRESVPTIFE
jgi:hypothetical protein